MYYNVQPARKITFPPPRCPLMIKFMLVCYFSPHPALDMGPVWVTPAGESIREWLIKYELVDDEYRATERGKEWVQDIIRTPLPELKADVEAFEKATGSGPS